MLKLAVYIMVMLSLSSCAGRQQEWTDWNKAWFASAIGAQAADVWSTQDGLDRGCSEANPLYGDDPSLGFMVLTKAVVIGAQYLIIEYLLDYEY